MDDCEKACKFHESCSTTRELQKSKPLPTRLLDVGSESNKQIKLVETKVAKLDCSVKYMTLSHCWGDPEKMLKLLPTNREEFIKEGIKYEHLPKTFQDVVVLARLLEIRYVWIDSLCIKQDNEEFKVEGQYMHRTYRNSYLNLSAAASSSGQGGLFQSRHKKDIEFFELKIPEWKDLGNESWYIFPRDLWKEHLLDQPLYARGWVFQERMLSPRILHFASKQIFWDCSTMSACETIPNGLPAPLDDLAATERHWRERLQLGNGLVVGSADPSPDDFWKRAVQNYTQCALTQSDDKLLAVWGVAKLLRDLFPNGEEYAVGMWNTDLHRQLPWTVTDYKKAKKITAAPSWSWASIHGKLQTEGCEVLIPSRQAGYIKELPVVKNHAGGQIAFELAAAQSDNPAKATDVEPTLEENRLAVQGHIFVLTIAKRSTRKWSLQLNEHEGVHNRFEVFPDTEPAESNEKHGSEVTHFYLHRNMHADKNVAADFGLVTEAGDEYGIFDGKGLILRFVSLNVLDSLPIFERTGAFTFRGIREKDWNIISNTSNNHQTTFSQPKIAESGLKLWLA
jgi:hypothetical protein